MAITPKQHQKIMQHIKGRFATLEKMLEENSGLRVIIAGDPADNGKEEGEKISRVGLFYKGARGHRLGCGLAHGQYGNPVLWLEMVQLIDQEVNELFKEYSGRVSCGQVSGAECNANNIHVFGANAANWNLGDGNEITGGGQAAVMGKQKPGVFGIVTTPYLFDEPKLEAEWAYDENWNPKKKADKDHNTSPTTPAVNTQHWYEDDDVSNVMHAYALEAGFSYAPYDGDEVRGRVYSKDNKMMGLLRPNSMERAFDNTLGSQTILNEAIQRFRDKSDVNTAQIFFPLQVNRNHWTMLEMNFEKKGQLVTLSSANFYDSAEVGAVNLDDFRNSLSIFLRGTEGEKVEIKQPPCAKQKDGSSCGPIACWYARQSMLGLPVGRSDERFDPGAEGLRKHQAEIVARCFPGYVIGGQGHDNPQSQRPNPSSVGHKNSTPPSKGRSQESSSLSRGEPVEERRALKPTLSGFIIGDDDEVIITRESSSPGQNPVITKEKLEKDGTWKVENGRVKTTDEYKKQWLSYYANNTRHADKEAIKKRTITENNKNGIDIDPKRTSPSPNLIKVLSVIALQASKDREEKSSAK